MLVVTGLPTRHGALRSSDSTLAGRPRSQGGDELRVTIARHAKGGRPTHPSSPRPAAMPSVPPPLDDLRPPSRYHGPCVVCGEPVIGQELLRIHGDALHAGCSRDWSDPERMSSH